MKLPWFMHLHAGRNMLAGVMPTPYGTFMRSCVDGRMELAWYPMDPAFPGGASRECKRLAAVDATDAGERDLELAVIAFMHAHPQLCLNVAFDGPACEAVDWGADSGSTVRTCSVEEGVFLRVRHAGMETLEFIPRHGQGDREMLARLSDACGETTLDARIDAQVRRRISNMRREDGRQAA